MDLSQVVVVVVLVVVLLFVQQSNIGEEDDEGGDGEQDVMVVTCCMDAFKEEMATLWLLDATVFSAPFFSLSACVSILLKSSVGEEPLMDGASVSTGSRKEI